MSLFSFILIIAVQLVSGQIDILQDGTVNTKGETLPSYSSYPLINSDSYWLIDLNNPDIIFELATDSSTFNFLITSIVIQTFDGISDNCVIENIPSQQDYLVSYEIGGQERLINLNSEIGNVDSNTLVVNINSIPVDRITISKRLKGLGTYCMRYGLLGYEVARVSVLSYGLTLPVLQRDEEYTGLCSVMSCFGGKGRLTDGITDTSNIDETGVGWSCPTDRDLPCVYNFRTTLTTTTMINRIELLGLKQGSADYPIVTLSGREVEYELTIDGSLFVVTVPIGSEVNSLNLSLTVQNGRKLLLTEFALFTGENVNIAVANESYTFEGILPQEFPTSATIANYQLDRFAQQTIDPSIVGTTTTTTTTATTQTTQTTTQAASRTTRVNNIQTNTTRNPQQTAQITTQTTLNPTAASIEQCMPGTVFASIIGVLGISIITMLVNSIIVVVILARNNRKIRRKLHDMESMQGESFKLYEFGSQQNNLPPTQLLSSQGTVIENMITTDDVYDSIEVPVTRDSGIESPNNGMLQRNYMNPDLFYKGAIPVTNSSCVILPNRLTDERYYECSVMDENEVPMEENVAFRETMMPQICVEKCESLKQDNLNIPMTENIGYVSSRKTPQLSIAPTQQDNLNIPMTENIGYVSSRKTPQLSIAPTQQDNLNIPMTENIGEPKQIYCSITEEYCVAIPERNMEMTGYNVLQHK